MPEPQLVRPEPGEIAPHARAYYLDLVPDGDITKQLSDQVNETLALLQSVAEEHASRFTYAPGKWTIKQIVNHLSDTERIFAYRALRLARQDATPLPGFEQDDFVNAAASNGRTLQSLLEEFRATRESTVHLYRSLSGESWMQRASVNGNRISVRGIAFTTAGHELHHRKILQERYLIPGA